MASKKFTLMATMVLAAAISGYGQLGSVLDYLDSSKISSKKLPQFNEWRSNSKTNFFPPVPRHMGQLGIHGGYFFIDGDCPPLPSWNIGLSYRKALGYAVSLRGSVNYAQAKGLDYRDENANMGNNPALSIYNAPSPGTPNVGPGWYIHSYKSNIITPSLELVVNLNNIMFHRSSSKFAHYAFVGYAPVVYRTRLNARNGNAAYAFGSLRPTFFERSRRDIRSDLKNFFDDSYETIATVDDRRPNFGNSGNGAWQIRHSASFGLGTEYRIAKRMSLGFEFKFIFTQDDYIDGWFLNNGDLTPDKDNLHFTNLYLNFNL